jgi:hypothetical protein
VAALVTCAVCALSSGVVQAAIVTENLTADLSGFINIGTGPAAPNSAVDGSFTVTFNTSSYISVGRAPSIECARRNRVSSGWLRPRSVSIPSTTPVVGC